MRNYQNLYLQDIHSIDEDFDDVWPAFSYHIVELTIKNCSCIAADRFVKMVQCFSNVKKIKLFGQQTFSRWGLKLKHLVELDLSECNLVCEDALQMIDDLPALEFLHLNWDTIIDIENVSRNAVQRLTIKFLEAIAEKKDLIKLNLYLPVPFYDQEVLIKLTQLSNIRLHDFSLKTSGDVPIEVYQQFFETQSNIEHLELQNSRALTLTTLQVIAENLKNLKTLSLPSGTPYFETPLEIGQHIPTLERISIKVHFEVGDDRRSKLIKNKTLSNHLVRLELPNIHTKICIESLGYTVESFPNLEILDLSFSRLCDTGLKIIFNKLIGLKELNLDKCPDVSNFFLYLKVTKKNQSPPLGHTYLTQFRRF